MARYDDDTSANTIEKSHRFDASTPGSNSRQEPSFSRLEELHEDGYEEPDRDTDFASGYRDDSVDDEAEYDEAFSEDDDRERYIDGRSDAGDEPEQSLDDDSDNWLEQEGEPDDQHDDEQRWPMRLILVAIVAVALLAAGGYGVLQQRAATQAELNELRATLAVAAKPEDAGASRSALESLQQSYNKLSAQAEALTLENRRLTDTVAGLEAQLGAVQSVPAKPVVAQGEPIKGDSVTAQGTRTPDKPEPKPAPAAMPVTPASEAVTQPPPAPAAAPAEAKKRAASSPSGPWFVNFGTYATRNMADTWANRVQPIAGEVIVAPNEKDGRTLYRVRVIGLSDRESAQQVARKLETDLRVPPLWVGRE